MKKIITVLIAFVITISLVGCSSEADESGAMQEAYDTSIEARKIADDLFADKMESEGISDYTIDLATGGFLIDEDEAYFVGYTYTHDNTQDIYGYKLVKTENGFSLEAEGTDIAEFIITYANEEKEE